MLVTARAQHWTDARPDGLGARDRVREVRPHSNWRYGGGIWKPVGGLEGLPGGLRTLEGKPEHWGAAACEFTYASLDGPLQVLLRDGSDPGNRALVGIRIAEETSAANADAWVQWKAYGAINPVDCTIISEREVVYDGLWDGCKWRWLVGQSFAEDTVEIHDKSACPRNANGDAEFLWTLRVGSGHSVRLNADNDVEFYRLSDGAVLGKMRAPRAWDDNGSQVDANITSRFEPRGPVSVQGVPYLTIAVVVDGAQLDASTGVVHVDPIIVLTGTTSVQDTMLRGSAPTTNWGGYTLVFAQPGTTPEWRGLVRCVASAIPSEGSITAASLSMYAASGMYEPTRTYRCLQPWYENLHSGSTGDASFNNYTPGVPWDVAGCRGSGTDFDPAYSDEQWGNGSTWITWTIPAPWVEAWKVSGADHGVMLGNLSKTGSENRFYSSEGANSPYWTLGYLLGGVVPAVRRRRVD